MPHTDDIIQHKILGSRNLGLHQVKNIATAPKYASCCPGLTNSADYQEKAWGGVQYGPNVDPSHTEFFTPHTPPFWWGVFEGNPASPNVLPGAPPKLTPNAHNVIIDPTAPQGFGIQLINQQDPLPGTAWPKYYWVYWYVPIRAPSGFQNGIVFDWAINHAHTGSSSTFRGVIVGPEDAAFISQGANHASVWAFRAGAFQNGTRFDIGYRSDGNPGGGYYVHSAGIFVMSMENNL